MSILNQLPYFWELLSCRDSARRIAKNIIQWEKEASFYNPEQICSTRKNRQKFFKYLLAVFDLFIPLPNKICKNLVLFETLRLEPYIENFDRENVIIFSPKLWFNRKELSSNYKELRLKALAYSVDIAIAYENYFFLNLYILKWLIYLNRYKSSNIFLYEDSQPLGAFFVEISKIYPSKIKAICIQHGYFPRFDPEWRPEGSKARYNLVWDDLQKELLLSYNKYTCVEVIGLPYFAIAKELLPNDLLRVYFIGIGSANSLTYKSLLEEYCLINNKINDLENILTFYRPHPSELSLEYDTILNNNTNIRIDRSTKLDLLNSKQSIFIGTTSSLLYEAKCSGHKVINMKEQNPCLVFEPDLTVEKAKAPNCVFEYLLSRAIHIDQKVTKSHAIRHTRINPHHAFRKAIFKLNNL